MNESISCNNQGVPSEIDWGDYLGDFESHYAYEHFFGKTCEEMRPYFENNPILACESLYYMPTKPFQYYIWCAKILELPEALIENPRRDYFSLADFLSV